jgi:hypothetical protein
VAPTNEKQNFIQTPRTNLVKLLEHNKKKKLKKPTDAGVMGIVKRFHGDKLRLRGLGGWYGGDAGQRVCEDPAGDLACRLISRPQLSLLAHR